MMSFLKSLFGGTTHKPAPMSANEGLEKLEENSEMLRKKILNYEELIDQQQKIAQQNANTNKTRALGALKKKKKYEEALKNAQGALDNLENQKDILENASSNAQLFKAIKDTSAIVKNTLGNVDIVKVEDIADELREATELSNEITNILSTTTNKTVDDDELAKELEELQQQEVDKKLLKTDKDTLPEVPTELPAQPVAQTSNKSKAIEEELDELKKWASPAQ